MTHRNVLYLSVTGILEPLGYSQVLRPIRALTRMGWNYHLVTCERADDLEDTARVQALCEALSREGIAWTYSTYRHPIENLTSLARDAARVARQGVDLVFARSYQSACVALMLRRLMGIPYVFDIRGYWVDEKKNSGRWFVHPAAYAAGKAVERMLFQGCAGMVSLTQVAADDARSGTFGPWPSRSPIVVIPTCADYDAFTLDATSDGLPEDVTSRLTDKLVIGFVGSVKVSYRIDACIEVFKKVRAQRDDVHLFALTGQREELEVLLRARGVDVERDVTITFAQHEDMPRWLTLMDWGMLISPSTWATRAMMPTKLAEFFAAGVRPVQLGCNDDVSTWVERAGSGVTLSSDDDAELARAASIIASSTPRGLRDATLAGVLERAREVTHTHFSLESGVLAYDRLLDQLTRSS